MFVRLCLNSVLSVNPWVCSVQVFDAKLYRCLLNVILVHLDLNVNLR